MGRLVVLLMIVLVVGVGSDWYQRNREIGHLLDATESSESAMNVFIAEEARIVASAPVYSGTHTIIDAAGARTEIQAAAGAAAAHVITTGDDVRDVSIWPWHGSLRKAQERYLAHSTAWQRDLIAGSGDYDALARGNPAINGTFLSASKAYLEAIPPFALHNARGRVHDIFTQ